MGTRRKSRELAMQMLFQGDLGKQTPDEVRKLFWASATTSTPTPAASPKTSIASPPPARTRSTPSSSPTPRTGASSAWPSSTATSLRAAVAEMIGYPKTPAAIIINESLEIAPPLRRPRIHPLPQRRARRHRPRPPEETPRLALEQIYYHLYSCHSERSEEPLYFARSPRSVEER